MTAVIRGARRWRRTVVAATLVIALGAIPLVLRLTIDADVLNLLPQSGRAVRSFRTYLSNFGSLDRVYIVFEAPAGQAVADYAPLIDRYVDTLSHAPEIARVDAQLFGPDKDWSYLAERVFLLLGPDATREALKRFDAGEIRNRLIRARERLAVSSPAVKELVRQDPLDFLGLLRDRLAGANAFVKTDPTQEGYVSPDGGARLVIARPVRPAYDTQFSRRVVQRLDRIASETLATATADAALEDLPPLQIRYAGGYHIALGAEREVRREAIFNLVGSLAGILLLLLIVFRSSWLFLVGAIPMTLAGVLSVALNSVHEPRLSAAAAGASALLFGLGIDGLVLLYARYLEERATVATADQAVERLGGSAASMLLGMGTSAATFLALTFVDFPSLQELGRLIGVGMLFGGLLTLVLVPALLPASVRRRKPLSMPSLAQFVLRRRVPVLWSAAIVTVILGATAVNLHLDLSLHRLQPRTGEMAFEREVVLRFGVPEDVGIVMSEGRDLGSLLETNASIERAVEASGTGVTMFSATALLPAPQRQAEAAAVIEEAHLSEAEISNRIEQTAESLGFRPGAFRPFLDRLHTLLNTSTRLTHEGLVMHGLGDLISPYVGRTSAGFVTAAYFRPRSRADLDLVNRAVDQAQRPGIAVTLTGVKPVSAEFAERLLPQFLAGVAIGGLVVFALVLWTFRSLPLTLLALLPTALGLTWGAGILALFGVDLDLFSVFGVLAFIGIGVDYGIHLVHRYAAEENLPAALSAVAPVNLIAGAIAVLGCGTLITSDYPPLRALGIVSVVTLATCLAGSLLVLPASLMMLERRRRPTSSERADALRG